MSNIYLLEPHTNGKVILHTSYGDIAVELWPKEAPKACRNFVQLCMEGYYDQTIFHRIVAGFIIQGGDPEGTGLGGESIYEDGQPFADEFHSRLRFVRRGLVAMANSGKPHDNRSQFFITLDATMELQNKHTIFGKIGGDTIYNVLKIGGLEVDSNERPLYPPKVTHCTIVVNPFDDIVPRLSRRELEAAARLKEQEAPKKADKQKKLKKNVALLSFGDDAQEDEEEGADKSKAKKKKMISSHDLLEDDPTLSKDIDHGLASEVSTPRPTDSKGDREITASSRSKEEKKRKKSASEPEESDQEESAQEFDRRMREQVRERHKKSKVHEETEEHRSQPTTSSSSSKPASTTPSTTVSAPKLSESEKRRQEIQKLEDDIRKMNNRSSIEEEESLSKNKKDRASLLLQEREQYKTRGELTGGKKSSRRGMSKYNADKERDVLQKLAAFEAKVFSSAREEEPNPVAKLNDGPPCKIHGIPSCESCNDSKTAKRKEHKDTEDGEHVEGKEEEEGENDETDFGWMQHKLVFEKDLKGKEVSLSAKRDDVDDYVVIDPLNKAEATTAAIAMEKQRFMDKKRKQEGRGGDYGRIRSDDRRHGSSSSTSRIDYRQNDRSSRDQRDSKGPHRGDDYRKSDYNSRENREGRDRDRDRDRDRERGGRHSRDSRDRRW